MLLLADKGWLTIGIKRSKAQKALFVLDRVSSKTLVVILSNAKDLSAVCKKAMGVRFFADA